MGLGRLTDTSARVIMGRLDIGQGPDMTLTICRGITHFLDIETKIAKSIHQARTIPPIEVR